MQPDLHLLFNNLSLYLLLIDYNALSNITAQAVVQLKIKKTAWQLYFVNHSRYFSPIVIAQALFNRCDVIIIAFYIKRLEKPASCRGGDLLDSYFELTVADPC